MSCKSSDATNILDYVGSFCERFDCVCKLAFASMVSVQAKMKTIAQ